MRRLLALLAFVLAGCTSAPESMNSATVERIPLDYDSTRTTGLEPQRSTRPDEGTCKHAWQAMRPHLFHDTSYDPPIDNLCTPVRCTKCGEERHECAPRRSGAR
jgi:hypothetical protein